MADLVKQKQMADSSVPSQLVTAQGSKDKATLMDLGNNIFLVIQGAEGVGNTKDLLQFSTKGWTNLTTNRDLGFLIDAGKGKIDAEYADRLRPKATVDRATQAQAQQDAVVTKPTATVTKPTATVTKQQTVTKQPTTTVTKQPTTTVTKQQTVTKQPTTTVTKQQQATKYKDPIQAALWTQRTEALQKYYSEQGWGPVKLIGQYVNHSTHKAPNGHTLAYDQPNNQWVDIHNEYDTTEGWKEAAVAKGLDEKDNLARMQWAYRQKNPEGDWDEWNKQRLANEELLHRTKIDDNDIYGAGRSFLGLGEYGAAENLGRALGNIGRVNK